MNAGCCYLCAMRLQGVIQIGGIGGQFLAHFKKTKNNMVSLAITSPFQLVENEGQVKNMK